MLPEGNFFDIWFTRNNEIIREVPKDRLEVWIREHRLASIDKIRPSGTQDWILIRETQDPLPAKSTPPNIKEMGALDFFPVPKKTSDPGDEVDMIPLIDVSLVLLVYYLMATSAGGGGPTLPLPQANYATLAQITNPAWVEILPSGDSPGGKIRFGVGEGGKGTPFQDVPQLIQHLKGQAPNGGGISELTIYAPPQIPAGEIRNLCTALETTLGKGKELKIHLGVAGKKE
ncbi:MAG: hypothetical protein EXR99_02095 [Gemmataceae bacterium]|nr:hypothetical protein [Gemmataceae bacterium]